MKEIKHLGLIAYLRCHDILPTGMRKDDQNPQIIWYTYDISQDLLQERSNEFFNKEEASIVLANEFYQALRDTKARLKQQRF